jgi:hypothetical protein
MYINCIIMLKEKVILCRLAGNGSHLLGGCVLQPHILTGVIQFACLMFLTMRSFIHPDYVRLDYVILVPPGKFAD